MSLSQYDFRPAGLLKCLLLLMHVAALSFVSHPAARTQEGFPPPPSDRSLVYIDNGTGTLDSLPFETGRTSLKTDRVAGNDKTSYIAIGGPSAGKTIYNSSPRFYLFVRDEANAHPPFIVHLTQKNSERRVTAMAQKGLKGFAIFSEEIVKPHYRVLSRSSGAIYMEVRPRESLAPGEYAIIGEDLQRVATFRVATVQSR